MGTKLKALEFFCGIGGFAFASKEFSENLELVGAWDNSEHVIDIYNRNHRSKAVQKNLDAISGHDIAQLDADLWWMSPPCAPYTRRGKQKHLADHRTKSFLALIEIANQVRPKYVLLENVVGFESSSARRALKTRLTGYGFWDGLICPRQSFGMPNRRKRYYAVACRDQFELSINPPVASTIQPCSFFLDQDVRRKVPPEILAKFRKAMLKVDMESTDLSVFTGAYAKSWVFSGSYLQAGEDIEIFSPREVLNFLGFPSEFEWGEETTARQKYKYVGNSLSIPVVSFLLSEVLKIEASRSS